MYQSICYLNLLLLLLLAPSTLQAFTILPTATTSNTQHHLRINAAVSGWMTPRRSNDEVAECTNNIMDRRTLLMTITAASCWIGATTTPTDVMAFDNKISTKYDDRPKRRGPQPKDLGVLKRKDMDGEEYLGLKQCGPAPNCFSSTDYDDPEHVIPPWKYPSDLDQKAAFEQVVRVIENYKPGQQNIDGGGFKIIEANSDKGYIYVQFEALKNGYIDDFEVVGIPNRGQKNEVQVRSSSRVGWLDFRVNYKRVNTIAKGLRDLGWDAPGVDPETHQDYMSQNPDDP